MMSSENPINALLANFKLPAQDLSVLSFVSANRASAVKAWAEALPAVRISHTSVLLYKAIPEIVRLQTSASNRLEMLEAIRPYVQHCIQALARGFLNQPLILPEGPMKTAVVAQGMQRQMAIGYGQVICELVKKLSEKKEAPAELITACHRAISGLGLILFRSFQLYRQEPANIWLELHTIFRIAKHFDILDTPVKDQLLEYSESSTINHAYLRVLMLACANPNQLRQLDVSNAYQAFEGWSYLIKLVATDSDSSNNLFVVNLNADLAPLYKSRFGGEQTQIFELDFTQLLSALRFQREQKEGDQQRLPVPPNFAPSLFDHLESSWSVEKQRAFERKPSEESLEVCVGLSNIHHHMTNGIPFSEFLGEEMPEEDIEEIDFGAFGGDPWSTSLATNKDEGEDEEDDHPMFLVRIVDTSPGGYCLEWRNKIPAQVKAGEAVGLREQGRHRWGLGVIRWVRQEANATKLGVQLLSPKTTPYAAAIELPAGDYGDFLRVLMLPEMKAANQPATLITPYAPFQEYQRIQLNSHGDKNQAQLSRKVLATGSISQFSVRIAEKTEQDGEVSEADESWDD